MTNNHTRTNEAVKEHTTSTFLNALICNTGKSYTHKLSIIQFSDLSIIHADQNGRAVCGGGYLSNNEIVGSSTTLSTDYVRVSLCCAVAGREALRHRLPVQGVLSNIERGFESWQILLQNDKVSRRADDGIIIHHTQYKSELLSVTQEKSFDIGSAHGRCGCNILTL
jgi:hypothetical protein